MATLIVVALAGMTLYQTTSAKRVASQEILGHGRIMLFSEEYPGREGSAAALLRTYDPRPAILLFPAKHPQGTHLLADLALSHWPLQRSKAGAGEWPTLSGQGRQPLRIELGNGFCSMESDPNCSSKDYHAYGRARQVRIEFLARAANDPDRDFEIPEAEILYQSQLTLPDSAKLQSIPLPLPPFADSDAYPQGVYYLIAKVTILSIYAGEQYNESVAIHTLRYLDTVTLDNESHTPYLWE